MRNRNATDLKAAFEKLVDEMAGLDGDRKAAREVLGRMLFEVGVLEGTGRG